MATSTWQSCKKDNIPENSISSRAETDPASNLIGISKNGYSSYAREFSRPGVYTYHDNFSSAKATISIFGREDPEE